MAATVNDQGGTVPRSIAEVVPKIQTRAAAVGLTLPAYTETSPYWRDQVTDQAKQAVQICPTPVPPASDQHAIAIPLAALARFLQIVLK